jgi:hypothetical protein
MSAVSNAETMEALLEYVGPEPVPPIYHGGAFCLKPMPWAEDILARLTFLTLGERYPIIRVWCATCGRTLTTTAQLRSYDYSGYGLVRRACGIASDHSREKINHAVFFFYNGRLMGKSPYHPLATTWP